MNKKVVLSVLSTAVVASMAASAFAAPKDGLYIGGSVNKFYSTDVLLNLDAAGKAAYRADLSNVTDLNNLVFVDFSGKGASIQEILDEGLAAAKSEALVKEDFSTSYGEVSEDGTVTGSYDARADVEGTTPGELKVESVSAINATQFKVVFNQEVNKADIVIANFKINGTALSGSDSVVLQADKKTVIATLDTTADFVPGTGYTVLVSGNIRNANNVALGEDFEYAFNFVDAEKPTVKSVSVDVNGDLKIEFSEPLAAVNPVVKVNGVVATVAAVSANNTVVTATPATALEPGKTYTVLVAEAEDLVGNKSDIYTTSVTTEGADLPSVTSLSVVDEDTVKVTFSKQLKAISGTDVEVTVRKGLKQSATPIAVTNSELDPDDTTNKTYLIDIPFDVDGDSTDDLFASTSTTSESIELFFNNFQDAFGNKVTTPVAKSATLVKDTVKPTLVSAQVASDFSTIDLTFSEEIGQVTDANITVLDADGVPYALHANTDVDATDKKVVHLVFDDAGSPLATIPEGTYTISLAANAVKDNVNLASGAVARNGNVATSTTVTVGEPTDSSKPTYTITDTDDEDNIFEVAFGTEVKGGYTVAGSAVNPANYKLDGAALPAGTVITFTDNTKTAVTIKLPVGSVNAGKPDGLATHTTENAAILSVSGVEAAKSGKVGDPKTATVYLVDNTAPELKSAQVIGNTILLTYSEAMDIPAAVQADASTEFAITVGTDELNLGTGGTPAITASAVSGNNKQVLLTLTLGTNSDSNWDPTKTIKITTIDNALTDANAVVQAGDIEVTATK